MNNFNQKLSAGVALAFILTSAPLHSADLIQFQAGQAAKASEVNANFQALNQELAALANFEQLSTDQIAKLRSAVGVTGDLLEINVDCTSNPEALQQEWLTIGERTNWVSFKIKGSCYANLLKQYHNFTLMISGSEENRAAKLIANADGEISLLGSFNGGLYLENLTIDAPGTSTPVLFSRSAEGNINAVTINGAGTAVSIQANAQAYISNMNILNSSTHGIRVSTGGSLRIFGNEDGTPLVQTQSGTGLTVDQAHVSSIVATKFNAPTALNLSGNSAVFFQSLEANGAVTLSTASQLFAQSFKAIGNINLYMNSGLQTNFTDIIGMVRASQGSSVVFSRGSLQASAPNSDNYNESLVLDLNNNSSGFLGTFSENNQINAIGHINLSQGHLRAERANLNVSLFSEAGSIDARNSSLNSSDEHPVNVTSNSSVILRNSLASFKNYSLQSNSSFYCNDTSLGQTNINSSAATFKTDTCSASGNINLSTGSSAELRGADFSDMSANLDGNSSINAYDSKLAIFHVRSNSDVTINQSEITGNIPMDWGDDNIFIDSSSSVAVNDSSIQGITMVNNNGILRFQNNASTSGLIVNCSHRSGIDYWTTPEQKSALIAGFAQYSCANNE